MACIYSEIINVVMNLYVSATQIVLFILKCSSKAYALHTEVFGQGKGRIWMDNVGCSGQETNITQCSHPGWGNTVCTHSSDAAAVCIGKLSYVHMTLGME